MLDALRPTVDADVGRFWPGCCAPITAVGMDAEGRWLAVLVHATECSADLEDRQAWAIGPQHVASITAGRDPRPVPAGWPQ